MTFRTARTSVLLALSFALLAPASFADKPKADAKPASPSGKDDARALSEAFAQVAERVGPSVVQIEVTARDDRATAIGVLEGHAGEVVVRSGFGSGVVISSDGAVLTNNHVVEDALTITVRTPDGRLLPAKLVGRDPATDLAVVRVDAKDLVAAKMGDSDAARVGEWVVAIGSPFGLAKSVTAGVVSAKGRGSLGMSAVEDYLQTDASINPGNSGGPLVNLDGAVLGINTMIIGKGSGIGFAVPSNMARRIATQLLAKGHVERAFIGVATQEVSPAIAEELHVTPGDGVLLSHVVDGSPGAKGNLKSGDIVVSANGLKLHGVQDFVREVLSQDVGATLALEVLRGGKHYGTSVTLAARSEPAPPPIPAQQQAAPTPGLGLTLRDVTGGGATACEVSQIALGSPADRSGLRAGDRIVEVDGKADPNSADVQKAAQKGHLLVRFRRGESAFHYAAIKS